jgi:hypothetical protein
MFATRWITVWHRRVALLVLLVAPCVWAVEDDDLYTQLKQYAKANDPKDTIRREELAAFLEKSAFLKALREVCETQELKRVAAERANGIFSLAWDARSDSPSKVAAIRIDKASRLLRELEKSRAFKEGCTKKVKEEKQTWGAKFWSNLTVKRGTFDDFDPRHEEYKAPSVISYTYDAQSVDHKNQFLWLGSLSYPLVLENFGPNAGHTFLLKVGVDADIEPLKPANETTVSSVLAPSINWFISGSRRAVFETLTLSASAKYTTDRTFDEKVQELGVSVQPTSKYLQMGMLWKVPGLGFGVTYQPTFGLEWGKVVDAAGNASLAAIEAAGAYTRAVGAMAVVLKPSWAMRLSASATCTWRYDLGEHWWRSFLDANVLYDIDDKKTVALTLAYRLGRKPPDFKKKDQVLFGIGLRK